MRRRYYNVFISDAWHRSAAYDGVVRLQNEQPRNRWRDYSVGKYRSLAGSDERLPTRTLKALTPGGIARSSCLVLTAGVYIGRRRWIQDEIDLAVKMDKPIVAVSRWARSAFCKVFKTTPTTSSAGVEAPLTARSARPRGNAED